ncbi:eukaryotic rRNA processing protein EBP2-domain-containing protein [Xylariaceae sp. FL1272]|nr:eukaryotic rRNA processing protein EBP2-domain-containing protein [Xylariaceae sp. FL1272]
MGRSKLKTALKAEKGIDIKKLKLKRKQKEKTATKKRNGTYVPPKKPEPEDDGEEEEDEDEGLSEDDEGGALIAAEEGGDSGEDEEDDDEETAGFDIAALDESSSDESVDFEEKIARPKKAKATPNGSNSAPAPTSKPAKIPEATEDAESDEEDEEEDEDEDEEDDEIDWDEVPEEEREDLVPRTRLSINNTNGLLTSLKRFALPTDDSVAFSTHQSITSVTATANAIGDDLMDDIKRELAFYAQSLDAAKRARVLLKGEGVAFSRPTDYFAEMVKDDGHMEKVKAKLIEDASAKKASAEARKLRDLKKFGKQVQVAKLQERAKEKRETLEKIKTLKRKRSETSGGDLGTNEADIFDVGVDNELQKYKPRAGQSQSRGGVNTKRQKKNEKYGFGGKKRNSKSGDAMSSGDMSGFSTKRMKSGAKGKTMKTARLGKSRRNAGKR